MRSQARIASSLVRVQFWSFICNAVNGLSQGNYLELQFSASNTLYINPDLYTVLVYNQSGYLFIFFELNDRAE